MALMVRKHDFFVHKTFCDESDYMTPSGIMQVFQDMGFLHAEEIGVGFQELLKMNLYWVVLYIRADVKKLPKFGNEITAETWPKEKGRLECGREFEITMNEETVITGVSNWVVMDTVSRRVARPDKVHFNGEYATKANYPSKLPHALGLSLPENYDTYVYPVGYNDLDHNGHMNNARYMDAIQNMAGRSLKDMTSFEIAFLHEVRAGHELVLKHYTDGNKECYLGYSEEKLCFEASIELENKE